jgi:hypothetical protein
MTRLISGWLFISIVVTALSVSAAGVMIGGMGSASVEMIWVGNTHLSYRADRIPWSQHWLFFFIGGLLLFCFIATIRWRKFVRSSPDNNFRVRLKPDTTKLRLSFLRVFVAGLAQRALR